MFESISSRMAIAGQNLRTVATTVATGVSNAIDTAGENLGVVYHSTKAKVGKTFDSAVEATVRSATGVYEFVMPKTTDATYAFNAASTVHSGETITVKPTYVSSKVNHTQQGEAWFAEDEFTRAAKKAIKVSITFKLVLSAAFIAGGAYLLTTGLSPVWFGLVTVALSTEVLNFVFLLYAAKKGAQ